MVAGQKRQPLVIANWKMHKTGPGTMEFCRDFLPLVEDLKNVDIVLCPPFTALETAARQLRTSRVELGGQNLCWERQGAFTGEISAEMLAAAGCTYVLAGHSERRAIFGEDGRMINGKISAALQEGLKAVLCVGEQLSERQNGRAAEVVCCQLQAGLKGISQAPSGLAVAYEPVWAIGTGQNALPTDAQDMAAAIRSCLAGIWGKEPAEQVQILYGGSVKPENIQEFLLQADIDGALVGGASLDPEQFARIARLSACLKDQ